MWYCVLCAFSPLESERVLLLGTTSTTICAPVLCASCFKGKHQSTTKKGYFGVHFGGISPKLMIMPAFTVRYDVLLFMCYEYSSQNHGTLYSVLSPGLLELWCLCWCPRKYQVPQKVPYCSTVLRSVLESPAPKPASATRDLGDWTTALTSRSKQPLSSFLSSFRILKGNTR